MATNPASELTAAPVALVFLPAAARDHQRAILAHVRRRDRPVVLPLARAADIPRVRARAPDRALGRARLALSAAASRRGRRRRRGRGGRRRRGRLRGLEHAGRDAGEPVPGDREALVVGRERVEGGAREVEVEALAAAAAVGDGEVDGFVAVCGRARLG